MAVEEGTLISLGGVDPNKLPANSLFLTLRREGQPAAVPDAWHWGTLDDSQIYLGHCYGRAFAWMLSQSDLRAGATSPRQSLAPSLCTAPSCRRESVVLSGMPGSNWPTSCLTV